VQVTGRWSDLIALMDARKKRLTDAVDFHQFFTDADDVDNWMLDILKLVSSDDIGQDEGKHTLIYLLVQCLACCNFSSLKPSNRIFFFL
jgi:hypothetical protein